MSRRRIRRALTAALASPYFLLALVAVMILGSTAVLVVAVLADLLEEVSFVSVLSIVALQLTGLGALPAAVAALTTARGYTLNPADRTWHSNLLRRELVPLTRQVADVQRELRLLRTERRGGLGR